MQPDPASPALTEHPLVERLIALELERSDFVIFGSGPLLAHGLRTNVTDLDVVARGMAWKRACELGVPTVGSVTGSPAVHFWGGRIEIFETWISTEWDTDRLIDEANVIAGLRFAHLADVLSYKRMLGRPKDLVDIAAIERRLDSAAGWAGSRRSA